MKHIKTYMYTILIPILYSKGIYIYKNEICLPNITISWTLNDTGMLSDLQRTKVLKEATKLAKIYNHESALLYRYKIFCPVSWKYVGTILGDHNVGTFEEFTGRLRESQSLHLNGGVINASFARDNLKLKGLSRTFFDAFKLYLEDVVRQRRAYCKQRNLGYNIKKGSCTVYIKQQMSKSNSSTTISLTTLFYLSIAGNTLSIFCLFILMLTFVRFDELQNLQGKNILCLSGTLLFSTAFQIVELFSRNLATICAITAILLHWSYLVSLLWMSVIAFDLFISFPFRQVTGFFTKEERFFAYLLVAVGVPTLVIIAFSVLNFSEKNTVSYGKGGTCFIHEIWANLFGFIVPAGFILLLVIIFVLLTMRLLYLTQSNASLLSQNKQRRMETLRVAITILIFSSFIILGWIFGFVGQAKQSIELLCFSTFSSSFQGMLMFVGFVYSKRIWYLWKRKICSVLRKYSERRDSIGCNSLSDYSINFKTNV